METLRERLADGRPFGFCPWEDGDGELWGILLELNPAGVSVHRIDPLGQFEEVEWYEFDGICYFNFGDRYSQRLSRLHDFAPTLPDGTGYYSDSENIERTIRNAASSGSVIRVKLTPDDSTSTVRVLSFDGEQVVMRDYDDLMQPYGVLVHRLSGITGVRAGTAYEEADEFLATFTNQTVN